MYLQCTRNHRVIKATLKLSDSKVKTYNSNRASSALSVKITVHSSLDTSPSFNPMSVKMRSCHVDKLEIVGSRKKLHKTKAERTS